MSKYFSDRFMNAAAARAARGAAKDKESKPSQPEAPASELEGEQLKWLLELVSDQEQNCFAVDVADGLRALLEKMEGE